MKQWMARILRGVLLVGVGLLVCLPPRPTSVSAQQSLLHLVHSTPGAAVIEFTLPKVDLDPISVQGESYIQVRIDGLASGGAPGAPQLPQAGTLIGLPPEGNVSLRILKTKETRVRLEHSVYPEPVPVLDYEAADASLGRRDVLAAGWSYQHTPDPVLYAQDRLYPDRVVELGKPEWVRDQRVARLTVNPVRYNPLLGELLLVQSLVVQVVFEDGARVAPARPLDVPSPAFEDLLRGAVLNYETSRDWRSSRGPATAVPSSPNLLAVEGNSYKVLVQEDGLYRLTYAALKAAGVPVDSVDPRMLQLYHGHQEVSLEVIGEQDRSFDPGDVLLFYGEKPRSRYVDRNVYWLRVSDRSGLRMLTRSFVSATAPLNPMWTTARVSDPRYYDSLFAGQDGDHWYTADLRPGLPHTVSVPLMSPSPDVPTATLRLQLLGYTSSSVTNPDHHLSVWVNGQAAGSLWWDGKGATTKSLTLDAALLRAGANSVALAVPGDTGAPVEGAWLDTVELDYALRAVVGDESHVSIPPGSQSYALGGFGRADVQVYDVTHPYHPIRLAGAAVSGGGGNHTLAFADVALRPVDYYFVGGAQVRSPVGLFADRPSDLHNRANGADYVVIAPTSLFKAVQPLANLRRAQGLRVAVVGVQDVYDEFGGGLLDPEAIRAFVAYAYQHWVAPAPTYVLLVGDGHYDFLDHFGYGAANLIPPYLGMVDPWWGETAADNRYAAVVGEDILPDVMLGRLPVNNVAEAAAVVWKIVGYEQNPLPGEWNARHVFVADDADLAGDFDRPLEAVHNDYVTAPWVGQRVYLDDLSDKTARQQTLAAWQQGALLMSYMGHSSWHQWAAEPLFDIHDVPVLQNQRRWPIVLSMTCFTGFFHHPEYGTLDESFLRWNGGGAVATWSSSGMGVQSGHRHLHREFYEFVFRHRKQQLGPAVLAAKLDFYADVYGHEELLDTYHLFGDPAMALNLVVRPWPQSIYLPVLFNSSMGG